MLPLHQERILHAEFLQQLEREPRDSNPQAGQAATSFRERLLIRPDGSREPTCICRPREGISQARLPQLRRQESNLRQVGSEPTARSQHGPHRKMNVLLAPLPSLPVGIGQQKGPAPLGGAGPGKIPDPPVNPAACARPSAAENCIRGSRCKIRNGTQTNET